MATKTYKDLLIWKKSFEVAKNVLRLVSTLPRNSQNAIITNQLIRASTSVGANIAEGYGRYGTKEYQRFLRISLGSANEVDYWLLLLAESSPKYSIYINKLTMHNTESIKLLASSIKTINKSK